VPEVWNELEHMWEMFKAVGFTFSLRHSLMTIYSVSTKLMAVQSVVPNLAVMSFVVWVGQCSIFSESQAEVEKCLKTAEFLAGAAKFTNAIKAFADGTLDISNPADFFARQGPGNKISARFQDWVQTLINNLPGIDTFAGSAGIETYVPGIDTFPGSAGSFNLNS